MPLCVPNPVDSYQEIVEGRVAGYSLINKFGRNPEVDTTTDPEDVWGPGGLYAGQPESFTPETVDVVSAEAADTSAGTGARTLRIYGLKTSASTAYETEDIILNGTSAVTSASTWWRINRAKILTAGSGAENAGDITIRSTTTTANVFAVMPATYNQTQIACWTVPAGHTAWLKSLRVSLARLSGAAGSAVVTVRCRDPGGVYRAIRNLNVTTEAPAQYLAIGGDELIAGADILVRVQSVSDNDTSAEASFEMLLVEN